MQLLASQYVSVPTQSLFLNAVKVVLFPIALGVICHMIFGKKDREGYGRPAYRFSGGYSAYHRRGRCRQRSEAVRGQLPGGHPGGHPAQPVRLLAGLRLLQADVQDLPKGFRYAQQKAITFEVGMQDSALGATLALTSFATNPLAAVPSTFFSVWHNISGSILSSWWRNHDDKHEIHWDSDNGEKGSAKSTVSAAHPFDADKAAKVAA